LEGDYKKGEKTMYVISKGNEKARVMDKEAALAVIGWLAELDCVEKVSFQVLRAEDLRKETENGESE